MREIVQLHGRDGRRQARRSVSHDMAGRHRRWDCRRAALVIAATGAASGAQTQIPAGKQARIEALQNRLAKEKSEHRAKPSHAAALRAAGDANVATQRRTHRFTS
jgi:hypothetical protein